MVQHKAVRIVGDQFDRIGGAIDGPVKIELERGLFGVDLGEKDVVAGAAIADIFELGVMVVIG